MSGLARMFDITNGVVVLRLVCGFFHPALAMLTWPK